MNRAERRAVKKHPKKIPATLHHFPDKLFTKVINEKPYNRELMEFLQFIINPSKQLDPHKIMRQLSDDMFNALNNMVPNHLVLSKYEDLFKVESMWRSGDLKEDWIYEWTNESTGSIHFLKN